MFFKDIHYNVDFEQSVLGLCLYEQSAFGRAYGLVSEENFYMEGHRTVFRYLHEMYIAGLPMNLRTVKDYLMSVKGLREIQGSNVPYFLTTLTDHICSSAHLEYECHRIQSLWMEREIELLTHAGTKGLSGDARKKIAELQIKLAEINRTATTSDWLDMSELMVKLYQHQDEMRRTGGVGNLSGFRAIDEVNGGFQTGDVVVIGARPSVGKSALAGQLALNLGRNGKKVGIIALEMSNVQTAARIAAIDTDTDFATIYRGLYEDEHQARKIYNRIGNTTSRLPIFITDKTNVNISDIRAKAEKLKAREGLDVVIIDYLQLVESSLPGNKNREQEVAAISRGSKIMAKEMGISCMVLCQLNRESIKRKGAERFPQLSDLRESGAIEQDADVVMFLHSDWMMGITQDEGGYSTEHLRQLVVRKWRNGRANFSIDLDFEPTKMKFTERRAEAHYFQPTTNTQQTEEDPF